MELRQFKQESPTDPFLPQDFGIRANEVPDWYYPFVKDSKGNATPKISIQNIADYLRAKGYAHYTIRDEWCKLQKNGCWRDSNKNEINQDIHELIRAHGEDRLSLSESNAIINQLSGISNENTLKAEFNRFKESPAGKKYIIVEEGNAVHVKNGWLDKTTGEILPECACILDTKPFNILYEKIPEENIKTYQIKDGPHQGKTYYDFYAGIIPDEVKREFYFSWLDSCFFDKEPREHILILIGRAQTGKTALTKAPLAILDKRGSNGQLSDITGDKFGMSILVGKNLFVINEISNEKPSKATDALMKSITDGGIQQINEKYKKQRDEKITTRLMMTGNRLPELDYSDDGIRDRICPIICNEKQKSSDNLHVILTSEEGKNWLFNYLIYKWQNDRKKGIGKRDAPPDEIVSDRNNLIRTDAYNLFLSEYCGTMDTDKDYYIIQEKLCEKPAAYTYNFYRGIAEDHGETPMTQTAFSRKVITEFDLKTVPLKDEDGTHRYYRPAHEKKRTVLKKSEDLPEERTEEIPTDKAGIKAYAAKFKKEHGIKFKDPIPAGTPKEIITLLSDGGYILENDGRWTWYE